MKPLRILRLISHLGSGGTERQCAELLGPLLEQGPALGVEVELCTYWNKPHLHAVPAELRWHRIDREASVVGLAKAEAQLAWCLRRGRFDVVHALLWPAAALALPVLPRKTALLTSIHSSEIRMRPGKGAALRAIGLRSDLLVFNSAPGASRLRRRFGVLPSKVRVRGNGKRTLPPPDYEGREGIVCVARMVDSKRQALLLEAWAQLAPDTRPPLTFIGRDTDTGEFAARARELGARTLGEVEDPSVHLCRAAIACLPTDHEGMPNAVLEAWNAGASVLASDVVGVRELVRADEDARLVDNEIEAWREALAALIADTEARERLARAGRARLEADFELDAVARDWVSLYHEAHRNRRG